MWFFIKPALYKNEKIYALPLIVGSIVLFYTGITLAYFLVLPSILHFFINVSPESVVPMTAINSYLSFLLKLFLVFGITYEIQVVTFLLILMGIINTQTLVEKRRLIVVGCFFIAMFITQTGTISLIILAIPMWLLFEIGLLGENDGK